MTDATAIRVPPARDRRVSSGPWWALPMVIVLVTAAFAGSFGLYPFFDDWAFPANAEEALSTGHGWSFILGANGRHWSPLWNAFQLLNHRVAGWESDTLIRSLIIAVQTGSLMWLVVLGTRLGLSRPAIAAGLGVLALHHANAASLYSFDTYSQCAADAVSWVAGGLGLLAMHGDPARRTRRLWTAIAILPIGFLIKEQALAGAAAVIFLLAGHLLVSRGRGGASSLAALAAVVALVVTFAAVRRAAGAAVDAGGPFQICVSCAPGNAARLLGATLLPVRSLVVIDGWRANPANIAALAAIAIVTLLLISLLVWSAWRWSRTNGPIVWWIAGLLITAGVPVVFLGRVGLLYVHTGLFWFALLVAMAIDGWLRTARGRGGVRLAIGAAACVSVLALAMGLRGDLAEMRATGERAAMWLDRYATAARAAPAGSVVLARWAAPERPASDFSLYRLTSPDELILLDAYALQHRVDRTVTIVIEGNYGALETMTGAAAKKIATYELRREGDTVHLSEWRP